jgi:hypothetical protein
VTNDEARTVPVGSPFVVFDEGKAILIVSCGSERAVFINEAYGDVHAWQSLETGERTSYTRNLQVIKDSKGSSALHIIGGGELPPSESNRTANGVADMTS